MIFQGHSGCKLAITQEGYVRKTSSNIGYNNRLIAQAEKQHQFIQTDHITAPKVIKTGHNSGLAFFEMEFLEAETFSTHIIKEDFDTTKAIFFKILDFIFHSMNQGSSVDVSSQVYAKARSINPSPDVVTLSFLKKLKSTQILVPTGFCHGDLTFENIMVNKQIYFIDFLDSFIESPIIDLAKISQEFNVFWSYRGFKNLDGGLVSKLQSLHNIFLSHIDNLSPQFRVSYKYFEILNLMRILPYTRDIQTYVLLQQSIHKLNKHL
jgi:thiamine kinase-like enzyme